MSGGGSPGQTTVHRAPGTRDPGAGWSERFFNSLTPENLGEYPSQYPGQLDPGMGPTLSNALRLAQGYGMAGAPEILGGVQGSLGQLMSPTFQNPLARVGMGFPNYFPIDPRQRVYGGGTATELGEAFPSAFNGNDWTSLLNIDPASGMAQEIQRYFSQDQGQPPGWGVSSGPLPASQAAGASPSLPPVLPSLPQQRPASNPSIDNWLNEAGANVTYDASGMPVYSQRMHGAKTAWGMGEGANRGQIRVNPATGQQEILMGSGQGGESYSWQPFDPNNFGHVQNATMFQRYGQNWTSGGRGAGGHSTDVAAELEAQLGRKPTTFEIQDAMYGVGGGQFSYSTQSPPAPGTPPPPQPGQPPAPGQPPVPGNPAAPGTGGTGWMKPRPGETPEQFEERRRQWAARAGDPNALYGGSTGRELMQNRDLIRLLGPAAMARWNAAHPALAGNPAAGPRPRNPAVPGAGAPGTGTATPGATPPGPPPPSPLKTAPTAAPPPTPSYQPPAPNTAKPVKYGWGSWG